MLGVVLALTAIGALVLASSAFAAGDPVASGKFKIKLTKGFKKQLSRNHVGMKPRPPVFKIKSGGASTIDPTTGRGTLKLKGKLTFKKGNKKLVYKNLTVKIGTSAFLKGNKGKIFQFAGGTTTRDGWGANVKRLKTKLLKGAAKKINKALDLHSLQPGRIGDSSYWEAPQTVEVTGGVEYIDIPFGYLPASGFIPGTGTDPNTIAAKQPAHCISPLNGTVAISPAAKATASAPNPDVGPVPTGMAARYKLPVTGGTIGPSGNDGVVNLSGGVRTMSGISGDVPYGIGGAFPAACPGGEVPGTTTSNTYLDVTNPAPDLALKQVQANSFIGGVLPGCTSPGVPSGCGVTPGDKGAAIGQSLDTAGTTVVADPTSKTITITGTVVKNNTTGATVLNGLFPNATSPSDSTKDFASGDKFGISSITVTTR